MSSRHICVLPTKRVWGEGNSDRDAFSFVLGLENNTMRRFFVVADFFYGEAAQYCQRARVFSAHAVLKHELPLLFVLLSIVVSTGVLKWDPPPPAPAPLPAQSGANEI